MKKLFLIFLLLSSFASYAQESKFPNSTASPTNKQVAQNLIPYLPIRWDTLIYYTSGRIAYHQDTLYKKTSALGAKGISPHNPDSGSMVWKKVYSDGLARHDNGNVITADYIDSTLTYLLSQVGETDSAAFVKVRSYFEDYGCISFQSRYDATLGKSFIQAVFDTTCGGSGGGGTFASNITVTLSGGKTLGRYSTGQTIPSAGKTPEEVLNLLAIEYVNPAFSSFSITGQSTQIEVGTTLSGSKTFTWGITLNSGTVSTIDLYDITAAATLLATTPNDGTQAQTITTNQLNTSGASQSWRGILHDTGVVQNINSNPFSVTGYFYRWYDAVASSLTNSASVRALSTSAFHTGAATFNLMTGTTQTKFVVALPPGKTIVSVFDLDALGADITSSYVAQSSINVTDAGGTSRAYNIYEMNVSSAYSSTHRHSITTN